MLASLVNSQMGEVAITLDAMKNLLLKLDVTSAMGPYDVHPYVLRACAEQLARPLLLIFQQSLRVGELPN